MEYVKKFLQASQRKITGGFMVFMKVTVESPEELLVHFLEQLLEG